MTVVRQRRRRGGIEFIGRGRQYRAPFREVGVRRIVTREQIRAAAFDILHCVEREVWAALSRAEDGEP